MAPGDALVFNAQSISNASLDLTEKRFRARLGGDLSAEKNVIWEDDGQPYALSRLTTTLRDRDELPLPSGALNGYLHWCLASDPARSLFDLAEDVGRQ